jgi:hypothetical protein
MQWNALQKGIINIVTPGVILRPPNFQNGYSSKCKMCNSKTYIGQF